MWKLAVLMCFKALLVPLDTTKYTALSKIKPM